MIGAIVANAVIIGINTFTLDGWVSGVLMRLDWIFVTIFVIELVVRFAADGLDPRRFFRSSWNTFDFLVVAVCFIPGVSTSATALRVIRLLRVSRLLRIMPDSRVLLRGLRRAAGPALSLAALTVLLCYLYAVVGWMAFRDHGNADIPGYFDNIGEAMLTMFELLTLEGWNQTLHDLRQVSPFAVPYVISFLLIGTYIVVNLVVGIVINSLDEAYKERDHERALEYMATGGERAGVEATINELRTVLDRLEAQLGTAVQADEPLIISGDGPDAVETTGAQNHQPSRNGSQLAAGETAAVELPRAEVADG
ncbi:MAG: ion transporter [Propionibacterium sp.]|nr:ion transporter [Propionibacterium sp.]